MNNEIGEVLGASTFVELAPGTIASDYALKNLSKSLGEAQKEFLPSVKSVENDYAHYDYVPLESIVAAVRPSLCKYHLTVSQFSETDLESKTIAVYTRLVHWDSGEWMQNMMELPAEMALGKEGALKFNQQTIGGSQTYGQKYPYKAIVGIPDSEGDPDSKDESGDLKARSTKNKKTLCPNCGKDTIIKGKEEYGGGWLCYKAKGGCGWKFDTDPALVQESHEPAQPTSTQQSVQQATQRAATPPATGQRPAQLVKRAGKNLVFTVAAVKLWPAEGKVNASMNIAFTGKLVAPDGSWTCEFATCWHASLFDLLQSSLGKLIEIFVTERDKDGRHFVDINDVVSITDEHGEYIEYQDGKPVLTGGTQ
jgi:predicted RNA-binding Zn-ribbon protein involved in translation (DUF1610 family)